MFWSLMVAAAALAQPPADVQLVAPLITVPAHQPQAITVAFSPDGKWLATSGANRFVTLRDPTTAAIRRVLTGHPGLVHEVAFSPDSTLLASAGAEGIVLLWSVESGKKLLAMQSLTEDAGTARTVAFSPDGRRLATGASDGTIKIWDLKEQRATERLTRQTLPVTSVRFSPDGRLLATATGNWKRPDLAGHLRLWEVASGKEIAELVGHEVEIKRIDFLPSGKQLVSAGVDRNVFVWDIEHRAIASRFLISAPPGSLAVIDDGRLLAVGDLRGGVTVWDLQQGMRVRQYDGHDAAILGIAASPDGKRLATASHDGSVKLWPAPPSAEK